MTFSPEALADLRRDFGAIAEKSQELREAFINADYATPAGTELAIQGFARRAATLERCLSNVFNAIPPDLERLPTTDELHDAEINIQASILGTIAATDNLAGIWVHERNLTRPDGTPLPAAYIGLRTGNRFVRESFSNDFRTYLEARDDWFDAIVAFRDALAHRIPLYIPPYVVTHANEPAYRRLEQRMLNSRTIEEYERLKAEQMQLVSFRAYMQHSYVEEAHPIVFHPQLLANFNTVHEMGMRFLTELAETR